MTLYFGLDSACLSVTGLVHTAMCWSYNYLAAEQAGTYCMPNGPISIGVLRNSYLGTSSFTSYEYYEEVGCYYENIKLK